MYILVKNISNLKALVTQLVNNMDLRDASASKNAQRWWIATFPAEIEKLLIPQQTQLIVVAAGLEWPIWAFHVRTYQTPKAVYFTSIVLFITTQWLIIAEVLKSNLKREWF